MQGSGFVWWTQRMERTLAFEDGFEWNVTIPHNVVRDCVLYTGTHDTRTVRGWAENEATEAHRERLRRYFSCGIPADELPWAFIRLAMATVGNTVILPLQDVLCPGSDARMNRPGTSEGNWTWRLEVGQRAPAVVERLRDITKTFGRD